MQVSITGKQIAIGDALRSHVETRLTDGVGKYFDHAIDSVVVLSRSAKGKQVRADISVHAGRGITVQGHGETDEAYTAFDSAAERVTKQLRRYKRRLRNHRNRDASEQAAAIRAQQYILAGANEDDEGDEAEDREQGGPVVIAEMTTQVDTLTVGEAVMRLDLANFPAMVFQNSAHGGLNVVFRRDDGNIGWIDPEGISATKDAG